MTMLSPALLLDTCAAIWMVNGDAMLDVAQAAIIHAGSADGVFVSPISAWEIGMLANPGIKQAQPLSFMPDAISWFQSLMRQPIIRPAPFTPEIAISAVSLPEPLHRDPGDRLLIATARHMRIPLMTRDAKILDYAKLGHVHAISC
jgi:PIN domain nuclease of toxin-antitoxin system